MLLPLMLSSCRTPDPPSAEMTLEENLPEATQVAPSWFEAASKSPVEAGWLESFSDSGLEAYVDSVVANNLDLLTASYRVEAAAAAARQAGAELFPQVAASGAGSAFDTFEDNNLKENSFVGSLGASWELDVWGRVRALQSAATAFYEGAEADFAFARLSLAAQASRAWFRATETYQLRQFAEEIVEVQEAMYDIVEARVDEGRLTKKELGLAGSDVNVARDALANAKLLHDQSLRVLNILGSNYPSREAAFNEEFVDVPPPVPAGLPSELIERRPDVIAAAKRFDSAFELVTEAKAARLPKISLTAATGYQSSDLQNIAGYDGGFWQAGGDFLAPIFTGGALLEQVRIQTAEQKAAAAEFAQTALVAYNEVEDALSGDALLAEREMFLAQVLADSELALEISETQFDAGKLDLLDVLQIRNRVIDAKNALISIRAARLSNRVDLYLALGGDFR